MGKLMTDEQMYINLTNASKELEELLREMKEISHREKDKGLFFVLHQRFLIERTPLRFHQ